jgi:hypothetical protein
MRLVERNQVGERFHADRGRAALEIFGNVDLQLVEENRIFVAADGAVVELLDVHENCALLAKHRQSRLEGRIELLVRREAQDADPLALERTCVERGRVIRLVLVGIRRCRIGSVASGDHGQQLGGVADIVCHRPGRVLAMADRHDVGSADEAHRGLQSDDPVDRCGAGHRAVGFRPDGELDHAGSDSRSASTGASTRVPVERPGVARLAADRAPARDRAGRANVRPFGKVGLADDDRAGLAKARDQGGIAVRDIIHEREASGGRRHRSCRLDIVLDQHRLAGKRARHAGSVDSARLLHRRRVRCNDGVSRGVQGRDPGKRRGGGLLGWSSGKWLRRNGPDCLYRWRHRLRIVSAAAGKKAGDRKSQDTHGLYSPP